VIFACKPDLTFKPHLKRLSMSLQKQGPYIQRHAAWVSVALCVLLMAAAPVAAAAEQVIDVEQATVQQGQASQTQVDALSEEISKLLRQHKELQRQADSLAIFNDNLENMIASQQSEMVSLEEQIENIKVTQREIVPLMLRMLETLEGFVERDVPFLAVERAARVQGLLALMNRADVDVSQKFRQIMDAYQVEVDYGRSIEAYRGELTIDGQTRNVEFLRIGRLAYAYQTLDRQESGFWHPLLRTWEPLEKQYHRGIRQGIRIAQRQMAPELIQLPVVMSEVQP